MAIGDAVAVFVGTAASVYQPSSGVEVQISSLVKPSSSVGNDINIYNGSTALEWWNGAGINTNTEWDAAGATRNMPFNMAVMLTNSMYFQKTGTADRVYLGGVQTNA